MIQCFQNCYSATHHLHTLQHAVEAIADPTHSCQLSQDCSIVDDCVFTQPFTILQSLHLCNLGHLQHKRYHCSKGMPKATSFLDIWSAVASSALHSPEVRRQPSAPAASSACLAFLAPTPYTRTSHPDMNLWVKGKQATKVAAGWTRHP